MLVSLPAEPILDHEVVALDPAQPAQHLPDYFGLPFTGDAVPWREKSDARGFPRLLRLGGVRRGEQRHERHQRRTPGDHRARSRTVLMIAPATKASVTSTMPPTRPPRWVVRSPQMKTMNPRLARRTSAATAQARTPSSTSRRGPDACGSAPHAATRRRRPSARPDRRASPSDTSRTGRGGPAGARYGGGS